MMCKKCSGISGFLFLLFGVLFLLRDFGVGNVWNISAWSVLFIIIGLSVCGKGHCSECKSMSSTSRKR